MDVDKARDVPVATPIIGVTSVGVVARTLFPEPVFATLTRFLLASVATAAEAVRPVSAREVPVAAPNTGATRVAPVARTLFPEPLFATLTRFLLASVATAAEAVRPVSAREVPVAAPIIGVTSVAPEASTTLPLPVVDFHTGTPVPPLANICPAVPAAEKAVAPAAVW